MMPGSSSDVPATKYGRNSGAASRYACRKLHANDPPDVFAVDLDEPPERGNADEQDDRQYQECENNELAAESGHAGHER
jgi:hypothetical protein